MNAGAFSRTPLTRSSSARQLKTRSLYSRTPLTDYRSSNLVAPGGLVLVISFLLLSVRRPRR